MGISVVGSAFSGFTGSSATESVTMPAGAAAGDTLIAVLSRRAALAEDMGAWTLQATQQASDQNAPSFQQWVDVYTKPYASESAVSIQFASANARNSLTVIVARTTSGQVESVWSEGFTEFSGTGGTIVDFHHRFPFRSSAANTEELIIKASTCKYAQVSGSTTFDDGVTGPNDGWAGRSNTDQHTPTSTDDNTTFVATEILQPGEVMLDGSGIGTSVSNDAHANHVTGTHDGASITIVFVDSNDIPPTVQQQFETSYADVSGRDPLPTALQQRTPARNLVNYVVGIYAGNNTRIVKKPVLIEQGELGKVSPAPPAGKLCREIWIKDPRDPNFKTGRRAVILGRSGGANPGVVELTLFIADNAASFVEPS